jgi:hypothetical protein
MSRTFKDPSNANGGLFQSNSILGAVRKAIANAV